MDKEDIIALTDTLIENNSFAMSMPASSFDSLFVMSLALLKFCLSSRKSWSNSSSKSPQSDLKLRRNFSGLSPEKELILLLISETIPWMIFTL